MTQNIAKDIRGKDSPIEPVADNRPLPSSTLDPEEELEESQGTEGQKQLPTGTRIVIRTVAPLLIGVLFIVLGSIFDGSVRYLLFFVAVLAFAWYALQLAWVEKEPDKHSTEAP